MNAIKSWISTASAKELAQLAKLAKTTVGTIRHAAGNYRPYKLGADLATRLDQAAEKMRLKNTELPTLPREQLSKACGKCEFAKRCRS